MISRRVIISGRVQGVGFRRWTMKQAISLGLAGWVRNRNDGTVEAVFSGDEAKVQSMCDHCRTGPAIARVDNVEMFEHEETETSEGFVEKETF